MGKESADERKSKPRVCHFNALLEAWDSADKARHKANVQLDIAGETTDNIYHMRALQSRRQTKIGTQRRRTNICDDAAPTRATMLGEISPERAQHEAPTRAADSVFEEQNVASIKTQRPTRQRQYLSAPDQGPNQQEYTDVHF